MKTYRIGIVGCGKVSQHHVQAMRAMPQVRIVSALDSRPEAAAGMAAACGATVARSPRDMIQQGVDGVVVCTPPAVHEEVSMPFLEAGVAVLCEKPLAHNGTAATAFARRIEATGGVFMVGFTLRFHPAFIELRRIIQEGRLGRVGFFHCMFGGFVPLRDDYRGNPALAGGGVMTDNGIHGVDMFRWQVGEPDRVQAVTANMVQDVPVEDFASLQMAGPGCVGHIAVSFAWPRFSNRVEVYGEEGIAAVSLGLAPLPELGLRLKSDDQLHTVSTAGHPEKRVAQTEAFLEAIRTGVSPVPAEDGARASRIIEAAYRSVAHAQSVAVPVTTAG